MDQALQKILTSGKRINNYIFITTEKVDETVRRYAGTLYDQTGGIEFVVLDCIGFLRHFLHLFHHLRGIFLENYQMLVLNEPASAVNQDIKEAFLILRHAVESNIDSDVDHI